MKILSRYVSRTVLAATLLVLFLLLGLDLVFSFIGEMDELKGNYQALQALGYVLLELPWRLTDIMPVAALVGGIVGLGLLANQSELTVMRASGVSIIRIVSWVIQPALLLVAVVVLVAQYVMPVCEQKAETMKATAQGRDYHAGELWGYWHREGDTFIQMQAVRPDGVLQGVSFYRLDQDGHLHGYTYAEQGIYGRDGWGLTATTTMNVDAVGSATLVHQTESQWRSRLTPGFLRLVTVSPEYLPLTSLYGYAAYLESQGLEASMYFLEFWKKALAPLATLSMVLIACSFIFGPLRSVTMGLRIISGILAGLGFRYLQDFSGYASLVYHFSPLLAATLPIVLCLLGGVIALRRVK